jgi:hypothetical protein
MSLGLSCIGVEIRGGGRRRGEGQGGRAVPTDQERLRMHVRLRPRDLEAG